MNKKILTTAFILGMISIILGAFGAHALKKVLTPEHLASFETGVRYQMYHALFLLFLANANFITDKKKNLVYLLVLIGVILFSGSIYLLTTKDITSIDISAIAFITPIGGLFLILAWLLSLMAVLSRK
ncbi:MAG TPA: DUF423 domain-containing protein [Flavobacterium sp.]|nr:DUF423 domain-containing protein [Flavobacterium sp.]